MVQHSVAVLLIPLMVNIHETTGECPQMSDIPVMTDSKTFTCMKTWYDIGDDLSVINACNGE